MAGLLILHLDGLLFAGLVLVVAAVCAVLFADAFLMDRAPSRPGGRGRRCPPPAPREAERFRNLQARAAAWRRRGR